MAWIDATLDADGNITAPSSAHAWDGDIPLEMPPWTTVGTPSVGQNLDENLRQNRFGSTPRLYRLCGDVERAGRNAFGTLQI